MIQSVDVVELSDHFDFFQFTDCARYRHIVWLSFQVLLFLLQAGIEFVPDNKGNEL